LDSVAIKIAKDKEREEKKADKEAETAEKRAEKSTA
jgi:hypothetical protein